MSRTRWVSPGGRGAPSLELLELLREIAGSGVGDSLHCILHRASLFRGGSRRNYNWVLAKIALEPSVVAHAETIALIQVE